MQENPLRHIKRAIRGSINLCASQIIRAQVASNIEWQIVGKGSKSTAFKNGDSVTKISPSRDAGSEFSRITWLQRQIPDMIAEVLSRGSVQLVGSRYHWLQQIFTPGVDLTQYNQTPKLSLQQITQLGDMLGSLYLFRPQQRTFGGITNDGGGTHTDFYEYIGDMASLEESGFTQAQKRLLGRVLDELIRRAEVPDPHLIHGDLQPRNILVDDNHVSLIDYGGARWSCIEEEVARMCLNELYLKGAQKYKELEQLPFDSNPELLDLFYLCVGIKKSGENISPEKTNLIWQRLMPIIRKYLKTNSSSSPASTSPAQRVHRGEFSEV